MIMRMMVLGVSLGALLGQSLAYAEGSSWYVGVGAGESMADANASDLDAIWATVGLTTTSTVDDKDTAWKIFGGYQLTENFGIEVAYMDFGAIEGDSIITAPVAGRIGIDLDTTAWIADAVGRLSLNNQFGIFGKVGIAAWDTDASVSAVAGGAAVSDSYSEDDTDFHFGVGADYAVTSNLGVRAEWERVDDGDGDLDAWTLGMQMSF